MLKKIVVGSLMVAVIGILVYGAVVRTVAKVEPANSGWRNEQSAQGSGRGRAVEDAGTLPAAASEEHEWVTLEGRVTEVDALHLLVTTSDGTAVEITSRAWTFIQSALMVSVDDEVSLLGFYEGETFEVASITVRSTGQVVALRDEYGRPLWSGRWRN